MWHSSADSVRTAGRRFPLSPATSGAAGGRTESAGPAHFIGDREFPKLRPTQLQRHDIQALSRVGFAGVTGCVTPLRRGND